MAEEIPTNSPLRRPPADYHPAGSARWFRIEDGPDRGKTLFYYDHAPAAGPAGTVLFVHGNPECSYTWRHVRDAIIASGAPLRLVAPDHIGFGLSDQAGHEMVEMHHAANLARLVRALDLRDVTLVLHDWGGPTGVGAFVDQPDRVRAVMAINSTVFPMPSDGYTYANYPVWWFPWCRTPRVVPDAFWGGVASYVVSHGEPQHALRLLAGVGVHAFRHALGLFPEGSPESVWSGQFRSRANARSSQRYVLQTPVWGHGYRYRDPALGEQDNHALYRRMQEMIPREWGAQGRNIPAAGQFGAWDACGKDSVIRQWQQALPRMRERTRVYPEHGHFLEEYRGREIAADILALNRPGR